MLALLMSEAATSKEADRGGSPRLRPSLVAARECVQPAARSDKRRFLPPATRLLPGYVVAVPPRGWRSLARPSLAQDRLDDHLASREGARQRRADHGGTGGEVPRVQDQPEDAGSRARLVQLMADLLADPTLRVFAICAAILTLKLVFMVTLIGVLRNLRGGHLNPEDYRFRGRTPGPPDELVERVRRAHQNDVENIPVFLAVGLLFALSGG